MVDTFPRPFVARRHLSDDALFPNDIGHLVVKSSLIKVRGFPWTCRDSNGNTTVAG